MDVGFQGKQEFFDSWFVEDGYKRNGFECRYDLCAFACRQDWPTIAFLNRDLFIRVNADDEDVSEFSCTREITDVSDVQNVETSIRQNDS
jgi:hypothetical protein